MGISENQETLDFIPFLDLGFRKFSKTFYGHLHSSSIRFNNSTSAVVSTSKFPFSNFTVPN